jgi:hypothetical protein
MNGVPIYVVDSDQLALRSTVGEGVFEGAVDVVLHADHVEALRDARSESYDDGLARGRYEHQVDQNVIGTVSLGDIGRENAAAYEQGQRDEREKHHTHYCCAVCDYHVMPHRRCILR